MTSHPAKKNLRNELIQKIESTPFFDLIEKSGNLSKQFHEKIIQGADFDSFSGNAIISFHPFGGEPQINIESETRDEPYRVGYVRISDWKNREMIPAQARRDQPGQWEEIELGLERKIHQPSASTQLFLRDEICMILVPGVGFSKKGERLGRGAGFYDRFLNRYPDALRVGIAFEYQLTESLPVDPWDEKIDVILTDVGIYGPLATKYLGEWKSQGKIRTRSP